MHGVGVGVSKKQWGCSFFLSCALFAGSFATVQRAFSHSCEPLFSSDSLVPPAVRAGLVRDLIEPAVQMYASLKQVAELTPPARAELAPPRIDRSNMMRPQNPRSHIARRFDFGRNGFLIDETVMPMSQTARMQHLIRDFATRARLEAEAKDPVRTTFLSIEAERYRQRPLLQSELDLIKRSPIEFAIVYAQMSGLVHALGEFGLKFSTKIPWTGYVDVHHFAALADIARMSFALNSEPAARRAADNMVLETLRLRFAPEFSQAETVLP